MAGDHDRDKPVLDRTEAEKRIDAALNDVQSETADDAPAEDSGLDSFLERFPDAALERVRPRGGRS